MKTYKPIVASFIWAVLVFQGCSKAPAEKVKESLDDIITWKSEKLNEREPFKDLRQILEQKAAKVIVLTPSNMESSLLEANNYGHAVILVGHHSLVKITKPDKKERSSSWNCQMPWGEGYTQKNGDIQEEANYINYLIGKPDQAYSRVLFLFE